MKEKQECSQHCRSRWFESQSVWCRHIHPSNRSYSVFGPAGDKQWNKPCPRPPVIFTAPVSLSTLWTSLSPGLYEPPI